jgi:hypothetical protein
VGCAEARSAAVTNDALPSSAHPMKYQLLGFQVSGGEGGL